MQRAKNEKLKKQYVDKMLLFLNNKYSRMFKDKKITTEKLRKEIEKLFGNQNFKNFDYQSNLKTVEKSILLKASKTGTIKYEPVQMSKINDLLNFDKDKYLADESEKNNENIKHISTNSNKNKSKEKNIKPNLEKNLQIKSYKIAGKKEIKKQEVKKEPLNNNKNEENDNIKLRPQSDVVSNKNNNLVLESNISDFNLNNNIVNNNNFSICNENNNFNAMNNLSEKMRKLKMKEQDEWAIKAKLDHDNYIKEQNNKKKEIYEKQMKQRELLENQIKEKKEKEEKLYNDKLKKQYKYSYRAVGENELNSDLNNKNNKIINQYNDNINKYMDNNKYEQSMNKNNINDSNRIEEAYANILNNEKVVNDNISGGLNNIRNVPIYNEMIPINYNNNTNFGPQIKNGGFEMKFPNPLMYQSNQIPIQINPSFPQNFIYPNQYEIVNPQNIQNNQILPNNIQYNTQLLNPNNPTIINNQNLENNLKEPLKNQNIFINSQEGQNPQNSSLNDYNNDIPKVNQSQNQNQMPYQYQELTNRNQFSDYDFRKRSGGDINQYYNEIRMRKQQIRDQYKQIEQENYLNAQKKKEEKKIEKEREKLLKKELDEPPEEMSNLLLREKKLKQKNLIDQIDFTREVRNNEELLKFEKQKKMEDFRKTLDEQVNQKKKMQQIKDMINNQEKKQDIYEMNQQFLDDVRNIQNRYENNQEIFMMNNIIGNNNNFNDYD